MACLCVTCREAQRTIRRAAVVSLDIISKIKCNIIYLKSKKRAKLIGKAVISRIYLPVIPLVFPSIFQARTRILITKTKYAVKYKTTVPIIKY